MNDVRLLTLDPGHFHAALVQKEMYPQVAKQVHVYAPLGPDLVTHLGRIAGFNTRADKPTAWEVEVHAEPFFLQRLLQDKPGNVVVLSGRNRAKIDYILAAVQSGLNVLADKPWILTVEDLGKLQTALDDAEQKRLIAYDIMTERYEITSLLQRELVQTPDVFGDIETGSPDEPAVYMESVHYLLKTVAGVPLRRPDWFFDITQQGEGLTDVGTHLVDLVPWLLFPDQPLDYQKDVQIIEGKRWPTVLSESDFENVTGCKEFPSFVERWLSGDTLEYYCNNAVTYTVRGVHVKLDILWDLQAAPGAGDSHLAVLRGTKARVEIHQGAEQNYRPEIYVIATDASQAGDMAAALVAKIAQLQSLYPGVAVENTGERLWVTIPDTYRVGHEAHFAQVTQQFLQYLDNPSALPSWEKPNMLAKYFVTTQGVAQSRSVAPPTP